MLRLCCGYASFDKRWFSRKCQVAFKGKRKLILEWKSPKIKRLKTFDWNCYGRSASVTVNISLVNWNYLSVLIEQCYSIRNGKQIPIKIPKSIDIQYFVYKIMGFVCKFSPHICDETVIKTLNGNFSSFNSSKYRNSYNKYVCNMTWHGIYTTYLM